MDYSYSLVLHEAQRTIFNDQRRFRVTVNGRRFGKSNLLLNELIYRSLSFDGELSPLNPQKVLGALPTAVQARQILFKPLVELVETTDLRYLLAPKGINRTSMTVRFRGKPEIKIGGANDKNGDGLRGSRWWFVGLDEMQDIRPTVWNEVVRPAMSDTIGSRALFTGTPKGKHNILFDLSELAKSDPDNWSFYNYPTSSNPTIPRAEIEQAKKILPLRVYEQEYEAKFTNFVGQIYTSLDSTNLYSGDLPGFDLVVAGVDFGDIHPAISIVARDRIGGCWYWLEGWSPNISTTSGSQPVLATDFKANFLRLCQKWGVQYTYCDPSRPSDILAIRGYSDSRGCQSAREGFNRIGSGISQVHSLIHQKQLLFVEGKADKVPDAIDGKLAYELHMSYHYVSRQDILLEEPADGAFSHICDSTRYALAYKGG